MRRRRHHSLRRRYGHSQAVGGSYRVRLVHKISPSPNDVMGPIHLPDSAFSNRNTLGAALRKARAGLYEGESLSSFRVEGDKVVAFPRGRSIWHSIILTKEGS